MKSVPFKIIFITDENQNFDFTLECVKKIVARSECVALIHRNNKVTARRYYEEAQQMTSLLKDSRVVHFTSRRLDIAVALKTHLHLPENAIAPEEARKFLPVGAQISSSIHKSTPEIESDLVLLAPVFKPISKPDDTRTPLGVDECNRIAAAQRQPTFALGGMSKERFKSLNNTSGYAVSLSSEDRLFQ